MHYIKLLPDDNSFVDYLICIDTKFADKGSFTLHKTYELHEETMEKNGNDLKYIIADDGIYWLSILILRLRKGVYEPSSESGTNTFSFG